MALAILEWIDADEASVRFRIDSGTNTHYQLKFGRDVREDDGDEWVDDVYYTGLVQRSDGGRDLLRPATEINVPLRRLERRSFAQLYTWKDGGKGQTVSEVVAVAGPTFGPSERAAGLSVGLSVGPSGAVMTPVASFRAPRRAPNQSAQVSRATSLESLLGEVVKIASPVVLDLIKNAVGGRGGAPASGTTATGGTAAGAPAAGAPTDILGQILQSLLGALAAPGTASAPPLSQPASLGMGGNRFAAEGARYVKPMIFGIDDALIAAVAGPILQVLPQLVNAANQKKIELRKSNNQLMGGIVSEVNKRLMMEKLLEAQKAAAAQGPTAAVSPEQLKAVADLLAALPAEGAAATPPAGTAAPQSLRAEPAPAEPHTLSHRAVLTFAFAPGLEWNGTAKAVFDRNRPLVLKPRLTVAPPVPKAPLSKAILKVVLEDMSNPAVRAEKVVRLTNVLAGGALECRFEPGELAHLPSNTCVDVTAELRWRHSRSGVETRALGSAELVLVNKHFLKALGPESSAERELTDMAQYRPFWNKVWEAPALDRSRNGSAPKKYLWQLDVNARYTTVLTASQPSNGLMETKLRQEAEERDSLSRTVRGRMKAGIELSVAELNKLIPLWGAGTPLDPARLEALGARPFLEGAARECKYRFRLKGRAGEAGMIWAVPVFKLFGITLSTVTTADDSGQVTATADETQQFPLPVAVRLIGLKSAA
jgi:hypothetical protein